jgi:hypothetical protein
MQNTVASVVGAAIVLVLYLVPSIDAIYRKHPKTGWIVLLNLLAGWTLLGWAMAFVWAEGVGTSQVMSHAGEEPRKRAA